MKSFEFELPEPIEYHVRGEVSLGNKVVFYAPKPAQMKRVTRLKQIFFRALPKSDSNERAERPDKSDIESEITGEAILTLVASSDADYPEFIDIGKALLCDKNGKIDDAEYLTNTLADKLDIYTVEQMVGQYVANFIVKSALKSLGKS